MKRTRRVRALGGITVIVDNSFLLEAIVAAKGAKTYFLVEWHRVDRKKIFQVSSMADEIEAHSAKI